MDVYAWINQARDLSFSAFSQATGAAGAGFGYVQATLNRISLFGSTESSSSYECEKVDEKHYFLIPDHRSTERYSLYTMRCLPIDVPPINDLPKQRIFHLPNAHALPTIEHLLLKDARETASDELSAVTLGNRLTNLADQIDKLDKKVFNGVLLVGGLVALMNPVVGIAITLKALMPSLGLLLSKFGLKYIGDSLNARDLAARVKNAENDVLLQFRGSGAEFIVNPVLMNLERALTTQESEYDPLIEFDLDTLEFGKKDRQRFFHLTCQAIANIYESVIKMPRESELAGLGPEDIRFLRVICDLAKESKDL